VGKVIPVDKCTLGSFLWSKHRVLVIGDSFATAFVQAFNQLVLTDNFSVTITSSWGASPVPEVHNDTPFDRANKYYWEDFIPSLAGNLRQGDWIFMINDMSQFSPAQSSIDSQQRLAKLETGLVRISDQASKFGVRLAVLHGNPFLRDANCAPQIGAPQWFSPFGGPCRFFSKEQTLSRRAKLSETLSALQERGKISIVDLIDVFCPDKTCTYSLPDGQMLYRDVLSHPSVEAARLSGPLIRDVLIAPVHLPSSN
jgi:hypothetical protein